MDRLSLFVPPALALLALAACGGAPPPPQSRPGNPAPPRERLTRLVERHWDECLQRSPLQRVTGAACGGNPGAAISPQALADSLAMERRYLDEVLAVPRDSLDLDSMLTYDMFRRERELAIEGFTYPAELMPVNPFKGIPLEYARIGSDPGIWASSSKDAYAEWQARADDYVRWTKQAIDNMRDGLRRGYTLPRVLVERTLPLLAALGEDSPSNVFYVPLRTVSGTTDAARVRLIGGLRNGVRDKILPAYRALHDFLKIEYLPRARDGVGLSALPLGESWYAFLIRRETGTALTAGEIHALGLAEVERIRGRLPALLGEASFTGTAQSYLELLHGNPTISSSESEALLNAYKDLKVRVAAAAPALFSLLPRAEFEIRGVPGYLEPSAPSLAYQGANPDGQGIAVLYVNTAQLATHPAIAAAADYLREAVPGHHQQLALQRERTDLPRFRRFGAIPAFVEGWGAYAASLGFEMGMYPDTAAKFESLAVQLQCALGLVIDTGLHARGWTRQKALEYVRAKAALDEASASATVDRDVALPGEALACTIGALKMQALRERAQQMLGVRFDIRAFHAEILKDGAMPLDLLDAKLKRWMDAVP